MNRRKSVWEQERGCEWERHCEYKLERVSVSESVCASVCMSETECV